MIFLLLFIAFFSIESRASGGPLCDTIFRSTNIGCDDRSLSNSSGGSYPLLFDAFNFNPSALPTFITPVGIEGYYSDNKVNFALIKGAKNVGFGASSKKSDTTFFSGSENYKVALSNSNPTYKSSSLDQYINLGTAVNIFKLPNAGSLPLGLSYRYNPETKKWSLNPGFELRTSVLSMGLAYNKEKADKYYDGYYDLQEERENTSFNAGLKISKLLLGYSIINQKNSTLYYQHLASDIAFTSTYTVTTHIFSGTLVTDNMSFTAAYRSQNDSRVESAYAGGIYKKTHALFGAAYKTDHLELGAFYNYVLNEDVSAVIKIFF